MPEDDAQRRRADGARGDDELTSPDGEDLTARQPRVRGDGHDADRDHRVLDLRAERGGDRDRKHERREREKGVDAAHREEVERAAEIAGGETEAHAEEEPDRHGDQANAKRDLAPDEHAREDVAPEVVRSQEMRRARREQRVRDVDLDRVIGCDRSREDEDEEPREHERAAHDHARIAAEEGADRGRAIRPPEPQGDGKGGAAHAVAVS